MTGRTPTAVTVLLLVLCLRQTPRICFNDRCFLEFALLSKEDLRVRSRSLIRACCFLIRASISWNSASTASLCSRSRAKGLRYAPDRSRRPIDSSRRSINLLSVLTPLFRGTDAAFHQNLITLLVRKFWHLVSRGAQRG